MMPLTTARKRLNRKHEFMLHSVKSTPAKGKPEFSSVFFLLFCDFNLLVGLFYD